MGHTAMMHHEHQTVKRFDARGAFAFDMRRAHHPRMSMKQIRVARGLSQRDLADLVGVDQSTIQRAEAMKDGARMEVYRMVAQVLNVEIADLFTDARSPEELQILEGFRLAGARERQMMIAMASAVKALPAQDE